MISNTYPHLLSPGRINKMEVKNRIMVTAMGVSLSEEDGTVGEKLIAYQVPVHFRFVEDFPRTPSMKPSAPGLKALFGVAV